MKKRYLISTLILGFVSLLLLTGCQNKLKELTSNPIIYKTGELNTDNEDTGYKTIEYNDKIYIMYGGINSKGGDITYAFGDCLGYLEDDKSIRIYELASESSDEWLIEYYVDGFMEEPSVYREVSTKENKNIPECVKSFDYDYWK